MLDEMLRPLRFGWGFLGGPTRVREEETTLTREDRDVPASLYLPEEGRDIPGWVVLHGITRPGRAHPSLQRFARALAGSGTAVLIPEIPEWTELRLAAETTLSTIKAAVLALDARAETREGNTGLIGFSFGAPQALIASTDPSLQGHLAAVVGFGSYCDIRRTVHFVFTGEHDWEGERYAAHPDPYGRWVLGANLLPRTEGYGGSEAVAEALAELARYSGDQRIEAWKPFYDRRIAEVRDELDTADRRLFDLFAPPAGRLPDPARAEAMASAVADAAATIPHPMDPLPYLDSLPTPVRLLHGRGDRLIPFTETLRLRSRFGAEADVRADITELFAHSRSDPLSSLLRIPAETLTLYQSLRGILGAV